MPDGLTLRATGLSVALAFGLTFAVQALLGGGSPAAKPAAKQRGAAFIADAPGAAPDLRLPAAVPALREPRQPRKHARKPAPVVRKIAAAPTYTPAPAPTANPRYTPTPRYIPPQPQPKPKPVTPRSTPAPPSTPTSGEFDTSGEPEP
jgi:hypothetical protein